MGLDPKVLVTRKPPAKMKNLYEGYNLSFRFSCTPGQRSANKSWYPLEPRNTPTFDLQIVMVILLSHIKMVDIFSSL